MKLLPKKFYRSNHVKNFVNFSINSQMKRQTLRILTFFTSVYIIHATIQQQLNKTSFSSTLFSIMDAYMEMTSLSSRFFQIIGMGMFHLKWHPWRVFVMMAYQVLSVISNGFVSVQSLYDRDINVFSTCIVILSATVLVVVKIMILLALSKEFNRCFRWIEMCFCEKYGNNEVDEIWTICYNRCSKETLFYTRWN